MKSKYSFLLIALLWCLPALSQVPVALAPPLHPKFTDNNGDVLAGGFLHTYAAGTTSDQPTYADSSGTILNTAIIPLDASGAPSNGSSQTGIWLANQSYKVCALNSSLVQQWCVDNVSGYLGILNLPNTWSFPQTFTSTITDTLTDNQMLFGAAGNRTTVDFPPPAADVTLHFPITSDTMVGRNTTDTETHKTLTDPTLNGTITVNGATFTPTKIIKSSTPVTITGDTAPHVIYTLPVQGGAMTTSGQIRVTVTMAVAAAGGGGTVLVFYGGTRISAPVVVAAGQANTNGLYLTILGGNLAATNSQSWDTLNNQIEGVTPAGGNLFHQTSAIDSTVNQNIIVQWQAGANGDSITFYRALVEIFP